MDGQAPDVSGVDRCDDGTAYEIADGDDERIDHMLGPFPDRAEELARADSDRRVDRMDLHPFTPEAREDGGVAWSAAHDLREHGRDGRNGEVAPSHLGDERSHAIPSASRTMGDR